MRARPERAAQASADPVRPDARRVFSLPVVAAYLSAPSIAFDLCAGTPWRGATMPDVATGHAAPGDDVPPQPVGTLEDAFRRSVRACIGERRRIAVLFRGDVASAALLAHAVPAAHDLGARCLVVVEDGLEASGMSRATRAQKYLGQVARGCDIAIADPARRRSEGNAAAWRPLAPDVRHSPALAEAEEICAVQGASLLLVPFGGDEALAAPRIPVASPRSVRRALVADARASGGMLHGLITAAAASRMSPPGARARLAFVAGGWAAGLAESPAPLAPVAAGRARAWAREWWTRTDDLLRRPGGESVLELGTAAVEEELRIERAHAALPPAERPIVRALPFADTRFLAHARALQPASRYDPRLETPYARRRARLLALVPADARAAVPAYEPIVDPPRLLEPVALPHSLAAGLLAVERPCEVPATVHDRVRAVEAWLAGAQAAGGGPARVS